MSEVNLTKSKYEEDWNHFTIAMECVWILLLIWGIYIWILRLKTDNETKIMSSRMANQRAILKIVILISIITPLIRIAFFVDPRGWKHIYGEAVFETLNVGGICLITMQWILIIMRWWELGAFNFQQQVTGNSSMVWWGGVAFVVLMTVVLTLGTLIDLLINGDSDIFPSNALLAVYVMSFLFIGIVSGIRAALSLFQTPGTVQLSPGARLVRFERILRIIVCLVFATPSALGVVSVSIWRGRDQLSPGQFFLYLMVRYATEVVLSIVIMSVSVPKKSGEGLTGRVAKYWVTKTNPKNPNNGQQNLANSSSQSQSSSQAQLPI
eukprot:c15881_g1_i1.p1 GENE.c15881_g1_i1~~c15881_g1_i1.p1  ORF type:complete len:355 (-),score=72.60 c15881_g1_i1:42-1010(-)